MGKATSCTHSCRANSGPVQNSPFSQIRQDSNLVGKRGFALKRIRSFPDGDVTKTKTKSKTFLPEPTPWVC